MDDLYEDPFEHLRPGGNNQHKKEKPKTKRWTPKRYLYRYNKDWMRMETPEAAKMRGIGEYNFRRLIISERGNICEVCGYDALDKMSYLHIHHLIKRWKARQLRYERSNVKLCCPGCHSELEKMSNKNELPTQRDLANLKELKEFLQA